MKYTNSITYSVPAGNGMLLETSRFISSRRPLTNIGAQRKLRALAREDADVNLPESLLVLRVESFVDER